MKKRKITGVVLITVLIFLQVILLLSCAILQIVFTQAKSKTASSVRHLLFRETETMLSKIEKKAGGFRYCLLSPDLQRPLLGIPLNEWPCQEKQKNFHYYYAVEDLGKDPWGTTQYYRITLANLFYHYKVVLQSAVAYSSPASVYIKRQMWREVY